MERRLPRVAIARPDMPYIVELRGGPRLGAAMHLGVAYAMFRAAAEEFFGRPVTLCRGDAILAHSPIKD